MTDEPWWKKREREKREYASSVSMRAWRAGIGADQNPDEVSRAFDRGTSVGEFVGRKLAALHQNEADERDRRDAQHRLETTCRYEDSEHGCWGDIRLRGNYNGDLYTCEGHVEMSYDSVYITEDGERIEVE